ncbi:MAG: hypothetical protein U0Y10_09725 [Spirosomataceae bacterium]
MDFIEKILRCNGHVAIDICPQLWENFTPTPYHNVRHCETCQKKVYLCDTEREIMRHANAGHCVAYYEVDTSSLPNVPPKLIALGQSSLTFTREQEEKNRRDAHQLGLTLFEYEDYQHDMNDEWVALVKEDFANDDEFQEFLKQRTVPKVVFDAAKAQRQRINLMFSLWKDAHIARRRCANCHAPVPQWHHNTCAMCGCTNTLHRDDIPNID